MRLSVITLAILASSGCADVPTSGVAFAASLSSPTLSCGLDAATCSVLGRFESQSHASFDVAIHNAGPDAVQLIAVVEQASSPFVYSRPGEQTVEPDSTARFTVVLSDDIPQPRIDAVVVFVSSLAAGREDTVRLVLDASAEP